MGCDKLPLGYRICGIIVNRLQRKSKLIINDEHVQRHIQYYPRHI